MSLGRERLYLFLAIGEDGLLMTPADGNSLNTGPYRSQTYELFSCGSVHFSQ